MAAGIFISKFPAFKDVAHLTNTRGLFSIPTYPISRQRLPTDSLGTCVITLNNVVVGSRIRAEVYTDGAEVTSTVAASTTVTLNIPYYASGNSNNNIRIKVRNASSSPTYQPYETQTVVSKTPQTIFINQILDE